MDRAYLILAQLPLRLHPLFVRRHSLVRDPHLLPLPQPLQLQPPRLPVPLFQRPLRVALPLLLPAHQARVPLHVRVALAAVGVHVPRTAAHRRGGGGRRRGAGGAGLVAVGGGAVGLVRVGDEAGGCLRLLDARLLLRPLREVSLWQRLPLDAPLGQEATLSHCLLFFWRRGGGGGVLCFLPRPYSRVQRSTNISLPSSSSSSYSSPSFVQGDSRCAEDEIFGEKKISLSFARRRKKGFLVWGFDVQWVNGWVGYFFVVIVIFSFLEPSCVCNCKEQRRKIIKRKM